MRPNQGVSLSSVVAKVQKLQKKRQRRPENFENKTIRHVGGGGHFPRYCMRETAGAVVASHTGTTERHLFGMLSTSVPTNPIIAAILHRIALAPEPQKCETQNAALVLSSR